MKKNSMKKSVVLNDRGGVIINEIFDNTDWDVLLWVVDDDYIVPEKYISNTRIKRILTVSQLLAVNIGEKFSYKIIEKFQYLFHNFDYGMHRFKDDIVYSRYNFYKSVIFWNDFFDDNHVDYFIDYDLNHGFPADYIALEIGVAHEVHCYHIFSVNFGKISLYDYSKKSFIKIDTTDDKNLIYNDVVIKKKLTIKKIIKKIFTLIFGEISYYSLLAIFNKNFSLHYFLITPVSIFKNYFLLKKNLLIPLHSCKKTITDSNYIIYFIHLEPEAVITNYSTIVDSQLFFIKMLSESLPNGWKLYVKEHPDSYRINSATHIIYASCGYIYKTKFFYDEINRLSNVEFIDPGIDSKILLEKAKAVSTVAGTVAIEAIKYNTPVILFGNNEMLYSIEKDYFIVDSICKCKKAIKKINDGFKPEYNIMKNEYDDYVIEKNSKNISIIVKNIRG